MKTKNIYIVITLTILTGIIFNGCISPNPPSQETYDKPVTDAPDLESLIDEDYSPQLSDIQKTWTGEYKGWDDKQDLLTKIRRMLSLNSDMTYYNRIQGVIVKSDRKDFVDFELEKGKYEYDVDTRQITFYVEYDSIIDFNTQKLKRYNGKRNADHEISEYKEFVTFSKARNNNRCWITKDYNLKSFDNKTNYTTYALIAKEDSI